MLGRRYVDRGSDKTTVKRGQKLGLQKSANAAEIWDLSFLTSFNCSCVRGVYPPATTTTSLRSTPPLRRRTSPHGQHSRLSPRHESRSSPSTRRTASEQSPL